ncbi:MAG: DUF4270 domain-containing protein [Muribaculaceae bacterium]|nr:DUF4270 domain-containing protein [Muribaculaceae bacterium]
MKLSIKSVLSIIGLTGIAVSCNTGNVGESIAQSSVKVVIDSVFTITGQSVQSRDIPARTTQQLLGVVKATDFGVLESDFVTQFMPASSLDTVGVRDRDIDSVKFIMRIPPMGFTGDSLAPMRASVYVLNKELPRSINSSFDPLAEGYCNESDMLGSTSYSATALGMGDSIYALYERQVPVTLPREWGQNFFRKYMESPATFSSPTEFAKWFPGVYVANTYGSGRVMHISSSVITFYYKKHTQTSAGKDTIVNLQNDYLATTPEVINNNNMRLKAAQGITDKIAAGDVIIQAPVGYNAEIKMPIEDIIGKFKNARGNNLGVINNLYLSIPAEKLSNDASISLPPNLLLIKASERESFFKENKVTDNITSYYALYNEKTKSYDFTELRNYIISLLDKVDSKDGYTITDDDCTFALVPVVVLLDTDYYGTSYVINVTPWVDAPVMCKLNLTDAEVKFGYSIQQLIQKQ